MTAQRLGCARKSRSCCSCTAVCYVDEGEFLPLCYFRGCCKFLLNPSVRSRYVRVGRGYMISFFVRNLKSKRRANLSNPPEEVTESP